MKKNDAIKMILEEYKAAKRYPEFNSPHEGYAILKEEVDELWDDIKDNIDEHYLSLEAKQVGAMALKFLICCC